MIQELMYVNGSIKRHDAVTFLDYPPNQNWAFNEHPKGIRGDVDRIEETNIFVTITTYSGNRLSYYIPVKDWQKYIQVLNIRSTCYEEELA